VITAIRAAGRRGRVRAARVAGAVGGAADLVARYVPAEQAPAWTCSPYVHSGQTGHLLAIECGRSRCLPGPWRTRPGCGWCGSRRKKRPAVRHRAKPKEDLLLRAPGTGWNRIWLVRGLTVACLRQRFASGMTSSASVPPPGRLRSSMVPRSSPVTSVRTICRPSVSLVSRLKPAGRPAPESGDRHVQVLPSTVDSHAHLAAVVGLVGQPGQAVLDRVEQQLVQGHDQWGGDLGGQHPEGTLAARYGSWYRLTPPRWPPWTPGSTIPSNSTASVSGHGERLVYQRDGRHPPHRLLQRLPRRRCPPGLAGAAARQPSVGCSSPGGVSPGWWRPWVIRGAVPGDVPR